MIGNNTISLGGSPQILLDLDEPNRNQDATNIETTFCGRVCNFLGRNVRPIGIFLLGFSAGCLASVIVNESLMGRSVSLPSPLSPSGNGINYCRKPVADGNIYDYRIQDDKKLFESLQSLYTIHPELLDDDDECYFYNIDPSGCKSMVLPTHKKQKQIITKFDKCTPLPARIAVQCNGKEAGSIMIEDDVYKYLDAVVKKKMMVLLMFYSMVN